MATTLEIDGKVLRKNGNVTLLDVDIDPIITYTEYTDQKVVLGTASSHTFNFGGLVVPRLLYIETDQPITFKAYRGSNPVASALPIAQSMLLTASTGAGYRFGTVTLSNATASTATISIYSGQ